ncbi:MAG: F0F1 ATP synthase subunit B [Actinomycetales bacterium]
MNELQSLIYLAAEEAPSPVIPHPVEIVVGLIAFSLLFYVLKIKVVPKFEKAYEDRSNAIQGGLAKAEKAQLEAESALKQYKAQLADARGEAQNIREEARVQGASIIEEFRSKAQEEAARITEQAQQAIESERQAAINSLRKEVGTLATELASKIVGEALNDQVLQSRVVDRFLSDLEKSK